MNHISKNTCRFSDTTYISLVLSSQTAFLTNSPSKISSHGHYITTYKILFQRFSRVLNIKACLTVHHKLEEKLSVLITELCKILKSLQKKYIQSINITLKNPSLYLIFSLFPFCIGFIYKYLVSIRSFSLIFRLKSPTINFVRSKFYCTEAHLSNLLKSRLLRYRLFFAFAIICAN